MRKMLTGLLIGAGLVGAARLARSRRHIEFRGRTVLITGGSRGLGLVLARLFAGEGAHLCLLSRDLADLERAALELAALGAEVHTFPCDVSDREEVRAAVESCVQRFGRLDVIVHDAGVIQLGPMQHMEQADYEEAMGVHFWGAYHVVHAALPYLRRQPGARIVNITSIGGRVAVPHLLPYAASKFALVGFSDGLRAELAREGIRVTTVVPGLMRTGSHVNALVRGRHEGEYAWFSISDALPFLSTSAEHAAERILESCRYGDPSLIITAPARLAVWLNALAPGLVAGAAALANRLLPAPTGPEGDRLQTGWDSFSAASPSVLTRPADAQVELNNELRDHAPPL